MNDNADYTYKLNSVAQDRHAIRFLVDDPVHGWKTFPLTRALAAYHGDLTITEYAGCTLRIAFAHAEVAGGHLTRLTRLECAEWLLDGEGRVDQDRLMNDIKESIDPTEEPIDFRVLSSVPVTNVDIMAIRGCLGVR